MGKNKKGNNPYLKGSNRLADVLTGIQFLSTYRFYKVGFDYWQDRIKMEPRSADSWKDVFKNNPEFFRVSESEGNVCLLMRRAKPSDYDVDTTATVTRHERSDLSEKEKDRITRAPLDTQEKQMLMKMAVDLHERAFAHWDLERRFWVFVPSMIAAATAIVVTIIKVGAWPMNLFGA